MLGPGGRLSELGELGNWRTWCGRPSEAPSIPYMEGALSYCSQSEDTHPLTTRRAATEFSVRNAARYLITRPWPSSGQDRVMLRPTGSECHRAANSSRRASIRSRSPDDSTKSGGRLVNQAGSSRR